MPPVKWGSSHCRHMSVWQPQSIHAHLRGTVRWPSMRCPLSKMQHALLPVCLLWCDHVPLHSNAQCWSWSKIKSSRQGRASRRWRDAWSRWEAGPWDPRLARAWNGMKWCVRRLAGISPRLPLRVFWQRSKLCSVKHLLCLVWSISRIPDHPQWHPSL